MAEKNIVFFFGSGAEGQGQYGLPNGSEFKKRIICKNESVKQFINSMNNYQLGKEDGKDGILKAIKAESLLSSNQSSVLYQTIEENNGNELFEKKFWNILTSKEKKIIIDYLERKKSGESINNKDFMNFYKKKIYEPLNEKTVEEGSVLEAFLDCACIYSYIDSMFNNLRHPSFYKVRTAKVMKLYYSAFLALFVDKNNKDNIDYSISIEKNDIRNSISGEIDTYIQSLVDKNSTKETYYNLIKKFKDENRNTKIRIITTNYTSIAEKAIGINSKNDISYLHGRLDLFENVFTKKVGVISDFKEDELIMPFIMVQSGVKPIVSPIQIKEFAKAIQFLNEADEIVMIGYGINSDDEHIITMLRDCTKDKPFHYFIYSSDSFDEEKKRFEDIFVGSNYHCKKYNNDADKIGNFKELLKLKK